jgi:hypothetical protein
MANIRIFVTGLLTYCILDSVVPDFKIEIGKSIMLSVFSVYASYMTYKSLYYRYFSE